MKIFNTRSKEVATSCMEMFNFPLPSVCISNRKCNFLRKLSISDNIILSTVCWISGLVLKCVVLLCLTYLAMVYFASFSFVLYVFYCCCLWWRIKLCVYSWYILIVRMPAGTRTSTSSAGTVRSYDLPVSQRHQPVLRLKLSTGGVLAIAIRITSSLVKFLLRMGIIRLISTSGRRFRFSATEEMFALFRDSEGHFWPILSTWNLEGWG